MKTKNGVGLGYEKQLWHAADQLRGVLDAAEYKHLILGLVFIKSLSDSSVVQKVLKGKHEVAWNKILNTAKSNKKDMGRLIESVTDNVESRHKLLKNVLVRGYNRKDVSDRLLRELVTLVNNIHLNDKGQDVLGRVYEYFLGQFSIAEGQRGGQYYTPRSIVKLLVSMLRPTKGIVLDPCCGSGGMFIQSLEFLNNTKSKGQIKVYGQELNLTTWRLCMMNIYLHGLRGQIKWNNEGSFIKDEHKNLKADYIIANPPFNDSGWATNDLLHKDRWNFGIPPKRNANYAWIQYFLEHLSKTGTAGFVLANGSLSGLSKSEAEIRKKVIKNNFVECIVSLPNKLFYNTQISASLWFLNKNKNNDQTLFIDMRKMGQLTSRKHRELSDNEISFVSDTYSKWRSNDNYKNKRAFCHSSTLDEIKKHNYLLVPGRYVGSKKINVPKVTNEDMKLLRSIVKSRFISLRSIEKALLSNLRKIT